jgi:hypothetical protein
VLDEVEMRTLTLSIALIGCSGKNKDADSAPDATCNDIVTERLGAVPVNEWPAGLTEAIPFYNAVGGRYTATATSDAVAATPCSGEIAVKLTNKSQEELLVVREPWTTPNLPCGCITDPQFPSDNTFDVVALHEDFQFYVEEFGDPSLHARTITGGGALYGLGEPMSFRSCGVDDVDPYLQSVYTQVTTVLRSIGGVLSATLVLFPLEGTVETCELTDFELVE